MGRGRTFSNDNRTKYYKILLEENYYRFGVPHPLILDNDTQFANNPFWEWCEDLRINQKFTFVVHREANGKTEVTNIMNMHGLVTRLDPAKGRWVDELPSVLWS